MSESNKYVWKLFDAVDGVISRIYAWGKDTHLEQKIDDWFKDLDNPRSDAPLKYQYEGMAHCKQCGKTHEDWSLSQQHWPPYWRCNKCDCAIPDLEMEIK